MELDFYNNHYVVHFLGSINPYDIELIYKPQEKYFSDEAKNFIETNWKNEITKNNNAYDGDLFDFISFEKSNNKLKLYYDYTKYNIQGLVDQKSMSGLFNKIVMYQII